MSAIESRLAALRTGLEFASAAHRPAIQAIIHELCAAEAKRAGGEPIPERVAAVDPDLKPPEADGRAVDGAGRSSEARTRQSAPAVGRPLGPVSVVGETGKAGRAGGAGGSPAPFPLQTRSLAEVDAPTGRQAARGSRGGRAKGEAHRRKRAAEDGAIAPLKAGPLPAVPVPPPLKAGPLPAVRECQWPHGDPGKAGFGFCGAGAVAGRPYCAEHMARAYIRRQALAVEGG